MPIPSAIPMEVFENKNQRVVLQLYFFFHGDSDNRRKQLGFAMKSKKECLAGLFVEIAYLRRDNYNNFVPG